MTSKQIHDILKQYWGYGQFRSLQEDIILSVLDGHDTLALLPTGGGKSICFQVPAMALSGICIVVSPLIALMKDQVEQLRKRGIPAIAIDSGLNKYELDIALDNCVYGDVKFLYLSPERLQTNIFLERVRKMKIGLLAIDEAHCISQWGYDFRPPYLEIKQLRELIPQVPLIALTATATNIVKQDIQDKLGFANGKVFQKSFARDNLSYSAFSEEDKERRLLNILQKVQGTAVVYVRNRKKTQEIAHFLQKNGISADFYHAGLSSAERGKKQDAWIADRIRVIVATNAFGMGIDKPDVRVVVHIDLPDTLEAYYQEAGRAGRDEQKAYAVALYNQADIDELTSRVEASFPPPELLRRVYQSLANYYKIAVGSSPTASYDFDFSDFIRTFQLPNMLTYNALKRLEAAGYIQFNEAYYSPSRIMMAVDNMALYEYQIANPRMDVVIKALLRMYGGEMFGHFVKISEPQLAQALHKTETDIQKVLLFLTNAHIVHYEPQRDKAQIAFTTARFDAATLPLPVAEMVKRKAQALEKANGVSNYMSHTTRCRTAILLEYFGEIAQNDCGVCDNCLKKKKQAAKSSIEIEGNLLKLLQKEPLAIQQLTRTLQQHEEGEIVNTLREWLDTNRAIRLPDGRISLK